MKEFTRRSISVFFAFCLLNVISHYLRSDASVLEGGFRRVGFPFIFLETGGASGASMFGLLALVGNVFIAFIVSILTGLWYSKWASQQAGSSENSNNPLPVQSSSESVQNEAQCGSQDECELCLNCLTPSPPDTHFCPDCGAPLSSYAATGPFELLFAEGHVYRNAAEKPRKPIVLFGMWLIFGLLGFGAVPILLLSVEDSSFSEVILGVLLLGLCPLVIAKTTRNYLSRKQYEPVVAEDPEVMSVSAP